jgi:hypothetical protein
MYHWDSASCETVPVAGQAYGIAAQVSSETSLRVPPAGCQSSQSLITRSVEL